METGANQGQKWIQHPQNRGVPSCQPQVQPQGPPFVDPKAPLLRPAVGRGPRQAPARIPTLGSTLEPTARPGKGAFGSTKVGPTGWQHGTPLLRVLNPFVALVYPSFKLLGGFLG